MGTIGEKRQQIRLEQLVLTSDGQGGHTKSYALRATAAAHERPLTGSEMIRAAQQTAVLKTVFEIWWRADVRATDRVRIGSRVLQIESYLDPTNTRDELHLFCSEAQA